MDTTTKVQEAPHFVSVGASRMTYVIMSLAGGGELSTHDLAIGAPGRLEGAAAAEAEHVHLRRHPRGHGGARSRHTGRGEARSGGSSRCDVVL